MEKKHSGLGIASCRISIRIGRVIFSMFALAGVMASTEGGIDAAVLGLLIIPGLLIILCLGIALVAMGLGIAGLCQKDKSETFSVLGAIFASLTVLGTILLIIIGIAVQPSFLMY